MATAYTSVGSGDWNNADTWDNSGCPGDAAGDSFTVAAGHTVSVNVNGTANALAGGTVAATGVLTFLANSTAKLAFTGNTVLSIAGTLNMDASGASALHTLDFDPAADGGAGLSVAAGGTINLKGRSKTGFRTLTAGAITATDTAFTVDDEGGWAVGDEVLVLSTDTNCEVVTLTVDNGSNNWSCSAFAKSYPDNACAWNLTRSCRIISSDAANTSIVATTATSVITACEWVEFSFLDEVGIVVAGATLTGCVARGMEANEYGFYATGINTTLDKCIVYSTLGCDGFYFTVANGRMVDCCALITNGALRAVRTSVNDLYMDGCYLAGSSGRALVAGPLWMVGCYVWDSSGIVQQSQATYCTACVFGADPGGNAAANSGSFPNVRGEIVLDDCAGTDVPTSFDGIQARCIMLQRNNASGVVYEYQQGGMHQTNTAEARSGNCHAIDPSSATIPYRYYIKTLCDTGKTPSLTFYAKGGGTLGNLQVSLGRHRCGLTAVAASSGSLDANRQFTVTGSYAQITINFTGTTDCAGELEVIINVLDDTSGILYVDDIAWTGNL